MASRYTFTPISDFSGGRNAAIDPLDLTATQVVQARNGDFHRTTGFRKRGGAAAPSIGSAFSGVISSLIAHTPANNPALAELWGVDDATPEVMARMAGAATFTAVTLKDAVASAPAQVRGVSFNGKLFLFYDSTENRAHVWDGTIASVRRVGLATPGAPTAADTGSGSYAATVRYYRVRWRIKASSTVIAQSEPGAALTKTPSGSGTHLRITLPTVASESETHWVIEASDDNVTFYELAEVAIGTTTYDDNTAVADYSDGDISPVGGAYEAPGSWKYARAAFNRLFGIGNWESGQPQSRLWFTPAAGTADKGDDERVVNTITTKDRRDLDEGTGGDGTGFAGPINGALFVFKYSQVWKIVPTGVAGNPIDIMDITKVRGAIQQEAICEGIDKDGRPTIYFIDPQVGPCQLGSGGVVIISDGIRDLWDSVNLAATIKVAHCVFYPSKGAMGQVWNWWASGSANEPDVATIYDIEKGGWSVWDTGGKVRKARAAVMFAKTLGASMSRDLVPYVSDQAQNNVILRCDTGTDDAGTAFQATLTTGPKVLNEGKPFRISAPFLFAKASAGVTLTMSLIGDMGRVTRTDTISIAAAGSETHVMIDVEGLEAGAEDFRMVQFEIGDAAAISNAWEIGRFFVPVSGEDVSP